jgi:tetratricopeptide (TPR) repeat protein
MQRICVVCALIFCVGAASVYLAAEETEIREIQAVPGDTVTLPLEPGEGLWEHRIVTPDIISVTDRRQSPDRVELVLSMLRAGNGRLEAVRIMTNRVIDRKYFFFKIEPKPSEQQTSSQSSKAQDDKKAKGGAKEGAEQQDLAFAIKLLEDAEYDAALQAFQLFRSRYPSSPELAQLALYEGQALYALKRPAEALQSLTPAAESKDERTRLLAQLWMGSVSDALGKTDDAIASYMRAFAPQHPDIDIRARTGLAAAYGRRGNTNLADEQFTRLFKLYADSRLQNEGYLPALFSAASFYDRDAIDAELAYKYYQEFLSLAKESLPTATAEDQKRLRQEMRTAEARLVYLRRNFVDYR